MNDPNAPRDRQLRELIAAVGRDAENRAPSFQRVWPECGLPQERVSAARRHRGTVWALAGAAGVILVAALGIYWLGALPHFTPVAHQERLENELPATSAPTAYGQMPTDFLLTTSNEAQPTSVTELADEITKMLEP